MTFRVKLVELISTDYHRSQDLLIILIDEREILKFISGMN